MYILQYLFTNSGRLFLAKGEKFKNKEMKKIKLELIDEICKEQNFDELLLIILKSCKENRVNKILESIENDNTIKDRYKKQIYEEIFEYVNDINELFKSNIKEIFSIGVKETIKKINNMYSDELVKGKSDMIDKIRIIIADDNIHICQIIKKFLEKHQDIEILGIANTDEDEIKMIDELKPDIVITDLMRNHKYSGLDIIRDYSNKDNCPKFLVISAEKNDLIMDELNIAGFIKKPFFDYDIIVEELRKIKSQS